MTFCSTYVVCKYTTYVESEGFYVSEVSIDEVEERMYIRKKDGSFWVCGEEVGAKKKKISYGPEGGVKERICTEQLMPLILKTE